MLKFRVAFLWFFMIVASGCTEKTSEEYIELAKENIAKENISAAIVELKNAISVNTQDPLARFMLGSLYAQTGSSAAAEKELARALELGFDPDRVLPILANAYSLQFKHQQIIDLADKAKTTDPQVSTSLLLYKAVALFYLDAPQKAMQAVTDANEISSDSIYSRLGSAYVDFNKRQASTSLEKISEILEEQPEFADAYLLQGQLSLALQDTEAAVESFEKYLELLPNNLQSHIFLANAYIKNKQFVEAERELDLILKVRPEQPFVNQLKGLVRFETGDFEGAKLYTSKAIQNGLPSSANRMIVGLSNFQLANYEQAYVNLSSIVDDLPASHPIRKLLSVVALKLGYHNEAADELVQMDNLSENDIVFLSIATQKLLAEGNVEKMNQVVDKVDSLDFTSPKRLAEKGIMLLSIGDVEGITDITEALTLSPELETANTALAQAYIDNGLYEKAIDLANTWIEKKPEQPNGYVLAAVAYEKLNDNVNVESMYAKAIQVDEVNPAANFYYADKALSANDATEARKLVEKVVFSHPNYLPALAKYYAIEKHFGDTEKSIESISLAYKNNPDILNFRLLLAQALYTDENYKKCIEILTDKNLPASLPSRYWSVLANAYFHNKEVDKSIDTVERLKSLEPTDTQPYFLEIALYEMSGDYQRALNASLEAKSKFNKNAEFKLFTTYFFLATNQVSKAEDEWANISSETQNSPFGQGLQGQILLYKGQPVEALPKLEALYKAIPSLKNRTLVAKALQQSGENKDAIEFLRENANIKGGEVWAELQIAEIAISEKNYSLASLQYQKIIAKEPTNFRALNNLAYLYVEENDYQRALETAKSALSIEPSNASIVDTIGFALLKLGNPLEAISYFEKALDLKPHSGEIKLHYAEALIDLNRYEEAKGILETIKARAPKWQADIDRVRAKLR